MKRPHFPDGNALIDLILTKLLLAFHIFGRSIVDMESSIMRKKIAPPRLFALLIGMMFLLSIYAWPQETTATVIFFKEDHPHLSEFKRGCSRHGDKWMIYMDDHKLLKLHRDRMAGFIIPAGAHAFRTEKSMSLSITFSPGDIVFLRPRSKPKSDRFAQQTPLAVVNCADFVKQVIHIQRVESKDLFSGETTKVPFAQACYRPR